MAALADEKTDVHRKGLDGRYVKVILKTTKTFYPGAMCSYDTSGDVVPSTDAASEIFAGIYDGATLTTTADTDGQLLIGQKEWIRQDGNITAAMTGKVAVVLNDQTLTNATTATNDVKVGQILELESFGGNAGCWIVTGKTDGLVVAP